MRTALIGSTGFVGSTLRDQTSFDELYNSKNIGEIRGREFDIVICAGAPAAKWIANKNPEADLQNLQTLMHHLESVGADRFILISSVDVYPTPRDVDEDSIIDESKAEPYGRHRYALEQFVLNRFSGPLVVRLPGLFGKGMKKNFIFDLIQNREALHLTHELSRFQFYDMSRLWDDLNTALRLDISVLNITSEALQASEVALRCAGVEFKNITANPPVDYNVQTKFASVFGNGGRYHFSADETLSRLRNFVQQELRNR